MVSELATVFERAQYGLRRFGALGTITRIASLGGRSLMRRVHVRERHLWYALDLDTPRPTIDRPSGFELERASGDDLPCLEELPTIGHYEARQRHAAGATLWLVRDGPRTAFACWIFRGRTPVLAAKGGWLELPQATVCLEDSVAAPAYRGRGLAAAVWSAVFERVRQDGTKTVITKVAEDNTASRHAVEKAGFSPAAKMTLTRTCILSRVELELYRVDAVTSFLVAALDRQPRRSRADRRLPGVRQPNAR